MVSYIQSVENFCTTVWRRYSSSLPVAVLYVEAATGVVRTESTGSATAAGHSLAEEPTTGVASIFGVPVQQLAAGLQSSVYDAATGLHVLGVSFRRSTVCHYGQATGCMYLESVFADLQFATTN